MQRVRISDVMERGWVMQESTNPEAMIPKALEHIRWLAAVPGGRGSCTPQERLAGEYAVKEMTRLGVSEARLEAARGSASTYQPYALALGAGLLGLALAWLYPGRVAYLFAALLNALGAWGMLQDTDLAPGWPSRMLPAGLTTNAIGRIPARGEARRRLVLCAHLDSHRTPIFFSSPGWIRLFNGLVGAAFVSLPLAALLYLLGAITLWPTARWLGLAAGLVQSLAIGLCLHADRTPFSPGANDNASGVGVALALAERLVDHPLESSEVWLLFTGCEETGSAGMRAFLNGHPPSPSRQDFYLVLDQVGVGVQGILSVDGLIRRRRTHPIALQIARAAMAQLPQARVEERQGLAYTDALVATRRGLQALSVCAVPAPGGEQDAHWHQLSDLPECIDPGAIGEAILFATHVLAVADQEQSWGAA